MNRTATFAGVTCLMTALVTGCASSDPAAGGGGGASASPIKVMTMGTFEAPAIGFKIPEAPGGVQARAKYINAHGGINGHKVEVEVCNTAGNVSTATQCARKAVSEGVVAVVRTMTGPEEPGIYPVLEKAGIPVIAATINTPVAGGSPVAFGLTNSVATQGAAMNLLGTAGATKISALVSAALEAPTTTGILKAGIEGAGAELGDVVYVAPTAVDITPFVAQAVAGGVDGLFVAAPGPQLVSLIKGVRAQGFKGNISTLGTLVTDSTVKALGPAAENLHVVNTMASLSPSATALPKYREDMASYDKSLPINENSLAAWMAMWTFERVAAEIKGGIDSSSVLKAMNGVTKLDMGGIILPLTTTSAEPVPGQPAITRLFNPHVTYGVVKDGKFGPFGDADFFNAYSGEPVAKPKG